MEYVFGILIKYSIFSISKKLYSTLNKKNILRNVLIKLLI
jgi:hypothetical protein